MLARITSNVLTDYPVYFLLMVDALWFKQIDRVLQEGGLGIPHLMGEFQAKFTAQREDKRSD